MIEKLTEALDNLEANLATGWQAGDRLLEILQGLEAQIASIRFEFGQREQSLRKEIDALLVREGLAHTRANEAQAQSAELLAKIANLEQQLAELKAAGDDGASFDQAVESANKAADEARQHFEAAIAAKQSELDNLSAALKASAEQAASDREQVVQQIEALMTRIQGVIARNAAEQADVVAAAAPEPVVPATESTEPTEEDA